MADLIITATATDQAGQSASASVTVAVLDSPPATGTA